MISESIKTLFSETDKLDELNAIIEECVSMETTLETTRQEIESLNATIAELRDTNMKLFLQVQGEAVEPADETETEPTVDEIFDEILKTE